MNGTVHITHKPGGIVIIEIDVPPANALNAMVIPVIQAELERAEGDLSVRAIVLSGRNQHFCAGADLGGMGADPATKAHLTEGFAHLLGTLTAMRMPVIAAIDGASAGGGLELALACDLRIAADSGYFIAAAVNVGLMASAYSLPRLIGIGPAKAMLLTGNRTDAQTALRYGLVMQVCKRDSLMAEALALAVRVATRAPLSVEATKRIADRALDLDPPAAAAAIAEELPALFASADHAHALACFRDRKTPVFIRG